MRSALLIATLLALSGCGFARQEQKDTVERIHETTQDATGGIVTHDLTRTVQQTSHGETIVNAAPPGGVGGLLGLLAPIVGTLGGPWGAALAGILGGGYATHKYKDHLGKKHKKDKSAEAAPVQ